MALLDHIKLIRVKQWYKNLVVFLAIFFAGEVFNFELLSITLVAFIALCFMSSVNYILNDLRDVKEDRLHPDRKLRPLASGNISNLRAIVLAVILFILSISVSLYVSYKFLAILLAFFLLTQIYTFYLKNILFADILTIASLFVIRAVSGAYAIGVIISPWLILCPFFLALFLAACKRYANVLLLGKNAMKTKFVLKNYTLDLTKTLMIISTILLIMSYSLYSFLSIYNKLLLSLPFALFVMFRYYYLVTSGFNIGREPQKAFRDWPIVVGMILWVLVVFGLIYV
jgi:4-hydroxybenzoate polyprenyltransferase